MRRLHNSSAGGIADEEPYRSRRDSPQAFVSPWGRADVASGGRSTSEGTREGGGGGTAGVEQRLRSLVKNVAESMLGAPGEEREMSRSGTENMEAEGAATATMLLAGDPLRGITTEGSPFSPLPRPSAAGSPRQQQNAPHLDLASPLMTPIPAASQSPFFPTTELPDAAQLSGSQQLGSLAIPLRKGPLVARRGLESAAQRYEGGGLSRQASRPGQGAQRQSALTDATGASSLAPSGGGPAPGPQLASPLLSPAPSDAEIGPGGLDRALAAASRDNGFGHDPGRSDGKVARQAEGRGLDPAETAWSQPTMSLRVPVGKGKATRSAGAKDASGRRGKEVGVGWVGGREKSRPAIVEGGSGTPVEEVEEDLRGRLITRSKVWDGEGLVAHVSCASYPDHVGREVEVVATFTNSSHVAYTFFICRAATPRYLNVTMGASKVRGGHRSGKEEGGDKGES